jgi:hypothetical protein
MTPPHLSSMDYLLQLHQRLEMKWIFVFSIEEIHCHLDRFSNIVFRILIAGEKRGVWKRIL